MQNDLTQRFVIALSARAKEIAWGGDPEQFVDSVIASVVQPWAGRLNSESKLACKLAQYLFDNGDQFHSRLQWNGVEWIEFPSQPATDKAPPGVE